MEKMYLKYRLDCPPPETRQLLKEKDSLIQKQCEKIKDLESTLNRLIYERDLLHGTLNQLIIHGSEQKNCGKPIISPSLNVESSGISSTPPSSSSSSSNSTSSLQSPGALTDLSKSDSLPSTTDLSTDLNENLKALSLISSAAHSDLIKNSKNSVHFLNDDYLQFIQIQFNKKSSTSSDSCRSSLSSTTKLDTYNSLSSTSNLVVNNNNPTSMSSMSFSTTPISSASSSLSSLKQQELNRRELAIGANNDLDVEEEKNRLNKLVEVKSFKNGVNSISSSMILSPNVKRPISKNTVTTGSNYRFKECAGNPNDSVINSVQGDKNEHQLPSIDYELSSDLKNKEIEMIYRKYGGHLRCKRAARVIQLAYRQYRLRKNYFKLCESNLKRRSFDMSEPISMLSDEREFENKYAKVNRPVLRRYTNTVEDDQNCDTNQFNIDLPSVDFEQLVEDYNKNVDKSDDSNKKESISSGEYVPIDYKNFDKLVRDQAHNHIQSTNANRNSEYDEEELDRTEDELDYEDQEPDNSNVMFANQQNHRQRQQGMRQGLLKTTSINKSASTSSIHTSHISPHVSSNTKIATPITAPNRSREFEDHKQTFVNVNPPVSNRSQVIKNQHQTSEQTKLKPCNSASGHTVFSSSAIKSPQGTKEGILVNKNIHNNHLNNQKVLSKSPCSVNSLFSATNKNHLFLTKESPKKQKSKVQKILDTQAKDQVKQTSKANSDIIVNGGTQVLKPEFDISKRKYLVGLNMFNRKPEKGINYLIEEKFLDRSSKSIAEFLFNRNCLSKQMIGDYISNTQDKFIYQVLNDFIQLIDLRALPVDEALRKFQTHFRMPGESQKIEHLINVFALRYIECNQLECESFFNCADETINVLSYAIILLNTSIHNPNVKANERMKFDQFLKMTKGIDNGADIEKEYMNGIYERVRVNEFKPGKDHTNSVNEFEKNLVGPKKPTTLFSLPHRRLVCLVQLYEIFDLTKKEKTNSHQRECFLFNDILVVTKVFSKKKNNKLYTYRCGFPLQGMNVVLFVTNHYQYGIRLIRMPEKKVLITFNARNENDQQLFCRDLAESIAEANEMEQLRIKTELDKFKTNSLTNKINSNQIASHLTDANTCLNDSGKSKQSSVKSNDMKAARNKSSELKQHGAINTNSSKSLYSNTMTPPGPKTATSNNGFSSNNKLRKRTLSNSLLDINSASGSSNSSASKQSGSKQLTLQRTGSECSLMTNNTVKVSLSHMLSLSSSKKVTTGLNSKSNITKASTASTNTTSATCTKPSNKTNRLPVSKETCHMESSADTVDQLMDTTATVKNQCPVDNLYKISKDESILSGSAHGMKSTKCNLQLKFPETDLFPNMKVPVNTHFVQSNLRQSQRVKSGAKTKEVVLNPEGIKALDLNRPENGISLEEHLRKKKIFSNDDYAFINYFGTPNIKSGSVCQTAENEMLLNNAENNNSESDMESLSPTSLNSQNTRAANAGKYFTISSNAGHRFRKIIKKYV